MMKTKNKVLNPKLHRVGSGPVAFFRGTIFARRVTIFAWGVRLDPVVRISVLAHRFRDEDKKKGLHREILGFVVLFTRVFVLERKFTHAWGDTSSILGGTGPKSTPVAPGLLLCFGAQSPLGRAHFSIGGHKQ